MKHNGHRYVTIGLFAVGAVLFFFSSLGGDLLFLFWALVCLVMMFVMMRAMGGMGGTQQRTDHLHDDGLTHSNDEASTHSHT